MSLCKIGMLDYPGLPSKLHFGLSCQAGVLIYYINTMCIAVYAFVGASSCTHPPHKQNKKCRETAARIIMAEPTATDNFQSAPGWK